jgi:hypothetical protein
MNHVLKASLKIVNAALMPKGFRFRGMDEAMKL